MSRNGIHRKVAAVPQSVLKKQQASEARAAKLAEERTATKKVRISLFHHESDL
jgi:hypothetical protein